MRLEESDYLVSTSVAVLLLLLLISLKMVMTAKVLYHSLRFPSRRHYRGIITIIEEEEWHHSITKEIRSRSVLPFAVVAAESLEHVVAKTNWTMTTPIVASSASSLSWDIAQESFTRQTWREERRGRRSQLSFLLLMLCVAAAGVVSPVRGAALSHSATVSFTHSISEAHTMTRTPSNSREHTFSFKTLTLSETASRNTTRSPTASFETETLIADGHVGDERVK